MHHALNAVCSPEGIASGVLIRAGEIVAGNEIALARRLAKRPRGGSLVTPLPHQQLARGPGNVAAALGLTLEFGGLSLFAEPFALTPGEAPARSILTGPRVGVAGAAGGPQFPWRFWLEDEPSVSAFRPGRGAPRP